MARKVSSRVVLNRKALTAIRQGAVAGMEEMGRAVLAMGEGQVPDATPFGEGLVTTGDYGVWADGRKVAGTASKPRRVAVKSGITLICGYGFPGRFQALGTIHIAPNPSWFVEPMNTVIPGAHSYLKPEIRKRLAGVR